MSNMISVCVGNNLGRTTVIVDSINTLRRVLESNNIDYSLGMTSLDGSTLRAGDLDKTFEDFGITEKCYLLQTVKADNAANVKVFAGVCVIESQFSPEEWNKVSKFRPKALSLYDPETKDEIFRVAMGSGKGSLGKYGATFGSAVTQEGNATITLDVPAGVDGKEWAMDAIGVSILNLNKVEDQFIDAYNAVSDEQAEIANHISIL